MKTNYSFTNKADIQACKELAKTMIKRDIKVDGEANDSQYYERKISAFFNCLNSDFRYDFQEWIEAEIDKISATL